jgi:hypothetical protein
MAYRLRKRHQLRGSEDSAKEEGTSDSFHGVIYEVWMGQSEPIGTRLIYSCSFADMMGSLNENISKSSQDERSVISLDIFIDRDRASCEAIQASKYGNCLEIYRIVLGSWRLLHDVARVCEGLFVESDCCCSSPEELSNPRRRRM